MLCSYFIFYFRWAEDLDAYKFYAENFVDLRTLAIDNLNIPNDVAQKLYDTQFHSRIKKAAEHLNYIKMVATNLSSLSDTMEAWINLYENTSLITEGSELYDQIFNKVNLTAFVLNPRKVV